MCKNLLFSVLSIDLFLPVFKGIQENPQLIERESERDEACYRVDNLALNKIE